MWASPGASRMFGSAEGFGSWLGAGVSAMAGHRVTYNGLCVSRLRYSNLSQRESHATFCGAVRFKRETVRGPGRKAQAVFRVGCVVMTYGDSYIAEWRVFRSRTSGFTTQGRGLVSCCQPISTSAAENLNLFANILLVQIRKCWWCGR